MDNQVAKPVPPGAGFAVCAPGAALCRVVDPAGEINPLRFRL
jgi:hypothetical protein